MAGVRPNVERESEPGPDFDPTRDAVAVGTIRLLSFIGMIAYIVLGAFGTLAGLKFADPAWPFVVIAIILAALCAATYTPHLPRDRLPALLLAISFLTTVHCFVAVIIHDLDETAIVSVFLVLAGFIATAGYIVPHIRTLVAYLGTVIGLAATAVIVCAPPKTSPYHFLLSVFTFVALAFVSVSSQMNTISRLARSKRRLALDNARLRQMEVALRESESRATALLGAVPDVMVRIGETGLIGNVYNPDRTALGAALKELEGGFLMQMGGESDGDLIAAAIEETFVTGVMSVVACDVHEPPGVAHIEIRVLRVSPTEGLALVRDMTQQRTIESRLRITDRLVSLGTLVGGVAHEINNPLAYLLNNVDFVRERMGALGADGEITLALAEAREGAVRIRDIVGTLKEHARPEKGELCAVDANASVRSALRMLDNQIRQRATVELMLDDVPPVLANGRLVQVIVNLVSNALQAMPDRPTRENSIAIRTMRRGSGDVLLEVEDNAKGISNSIVGRIFDPFFTTKGPGGGTGLGLYLCHCLVTSFEGNIALSSTEGVGSNFAVTLRAAGPATAARVPSLPVRAARVDGSALIIDDEPFIGRSLARLLCPAEVCVVGSAAEALDMCRQRDFSVILCDVMMPEMDGIAFHEALSLERPELAHRVVFMTGGAFTERAKNFLEAVPNPSLPKPFGHAQLSEAMARIAAFEADQPAPLPLAASTRS